MDVEICPYHPFTDRARHYDETVKDHDRHYYGYAQAHDQHRL